MAEASCSPTSGSPLPGAAETPMAPPQLALLDFFFPGFSIFSGAVQKYLHVDLNLYIPLVLLFGGMTFAWQYFSDYLWEKLDNHFMSTVDVRTEDEAYNMLMGWVAAQKFAQGARRFVVNTNLNSRSWFLWRWDDDDEQGEEGDEGSAEHAAKKKALSYTPTFGSHYFWYKGRLLIFRRSQNREQSSFLVASEREEISISCFGRNPWVLKELLHEARLQYMKRDERKTLIYRGTTRAGSTEPTWQRCMARTSRPFSTVILNEKVKKDLIDDVTDYLDPSTRRWFANRGIPYRRGYLLYGPPGTGKSSLSLALAGFFKMRIYIVSLSSMAANEENLASLFAELPRRCVVLLEDIDTAGLTHTREENGAVGDKAGDNDDMVPGQITRGGGGSTPAASGRLSLSGLLNILDGVASQEGRVLIMTTNHLEKLDKALIRPGRVDMIVKFDNADSGMTAAIFRAIFAPLEGDNAPETPVNRGLLDPAVEEKRAAAEAEKREEAVVRVNALSEEFAAKVPAYEFSPAELQGYLMKSKRNPEGAVAGVEQWVVETRKEKKEKELREAEEKRKAEEEKKKKEEKEAKKKRKEAKKNESKKKQKAKKAEGGDSDSSDSSEPGSEAETPAKKESKKESKKKNKKKKAENESESDSSGSSSSESESEAPAKKDSAVEGKPQKAAKVEKAAKAEKVEKVEKAEKTEKADEAETTPSAHKDEGKGSADEGKTGADSGYGTP